MEDDHGHSTELLESLDSQAKSVRLTAWAGLCSNLVISGIKIAAGIYGNSRAVLADGVHSLSDLTSDLALIIGVRFWSAPPDDSHQYGHRRIETLITLFIGLLLAAVAIGIAYESLSTIAEKHQRPPGYVALGAALLSIVTKEWLFRWTAGIGRRIGSSAVKANAWHHRSDGFSSIPAAVAVAGSIIIPGWQFLDHIGAALVTVLIMNAAFKISWPALQELIDASASEETVDKIRQICLDTRGCKGVHKIRTRRHGSGIQVDLHVLVHSELSVNEGHDIAEDVKKRIMEARPDVIDVVTHLEPEVEENPQPAP